MKLQHSPHALIVSREGGPKIYRESTFYHYAVKELRKLGEDVVRRVPAKDGHLTGAPYYIRDRKGTL